MTFSDLVDATLPFGLAPIIVPELKTITIGGAVAGCSIESMSFRVGGFHDTCLAYQVLTGTGLTLDEAARRLHRGDELPELTPIQRRLVEERATSFPVP